jgi:hypothetical protein
MKYVLVKRSFYSLANQNLLFHWLRFFLIFRNFALQNFLYLIEICLSVWLSVTSVRWAQTVTTTAVVHTSFESLILLVSESVSFFDMGHP